MNGYLILILGFFVPMAVQAGAGVIDSIAPACASVGAQVTITGNGFGARNVAITVGGTPAMVVAATGNTATFVVPAAAPLGATTVTATNPGGHTGSIGFKVCDLLVPDAWGGEWAIKSTYRKATTNSVTLTDDITAFIRRDEPFGLEPAAKAGNCTGSVSDTHIQIQCTGQSAGVQCALGVSTQITADRTGDTITGTGTVALTFSTGCAPLVSEVETIQVSGHRLTLNQGPLNSPNTLVRSFVPFAGLIGAGH